MRQPELVGVVLGAGDGVRMGGSKALLLVDGEPLATVHARRLREAGCARVVVVVRPDVVGKLGLVEWTRVVASRAEDPAGSLAVAMREGSIDADAIVVITPVDAAPVAKETIEALLVALGKDGMTEAATPVCGGKGGHPVVCRGRLLEGFRFGGATPPLRDVLRALGDRRVKVETEDPRVLVDLDSPEDVVAWTGAQPSFHGA